MKIIFYILWLLVITIGAFTNHLVENPYMFGFFIGTISFAFLRLGSEM